MQVLTKLLPSDNGMAASCCEPTLRSSAFPGIKASCTSIIFDLRNATSFSAEQSWPRSPCSNYPKHKGRVTNGDNAVKHDFAKRITRS
eukprot:s648_g8.t1